MVKGSARFSPVRSAQKRPQICPEKRTIVQPSSVKLGLMNCRSVNNKYGFIVDHILENRLDILSMTETWLSANDVQNRPVVSEFEKHGYYFHHRPRCSGRGSGVRSKRHSPQVVELSQQTRTAVQIVSNPPAPSNGGPIYRFLGMPAMRTRWMAGAAAHKSG